MTLDNMPTMLHIRFQKMNQLVNSKKNVPKENYPTKSNLKLNSRLINLKLNSRLIISNQFPQTRHTQRFLASFFDIVQDLVPEVLVRWIR